MQTKKIAPTFADASVTMAVSVKKPLHTRAAVREMGDIKRSVDHIRFFGDGTSVYLIGCTSSCDNDNREMKSEHLSPSLSEYD